MQAAYADPHASLVRLVLAPGEQFATLAHPADAAGPLVSVIAAEPGNTEFDALMAATAAGSLAIAPYAAPAPSPPDRISRRQFFQQLAIIGAISEAEAEAAMGGVIPGDMLALVGMLPAEERFGLRMALRAAEFALSDPRTTILRQLYLWSAETLLAFWQDASELP